MIVNTDFFERRSFFILFFVILHVLETGPMDDHINLNFESIKTSYYDGKGLLQPLYDDLQNRVNTNSSFTGVDRIVADMFDALDTFYRDLVRDEWIYFITDGRCNTEGSRFIAKIMNLVVNNFITSSFPSPITEWLVLFQDASTGAQWQHLAERMDVCMDSFLEWVKQLMTFSESKVNIARMRKYSDFMNSVVGLLTTDDDSLPPDHIRALREDLQRGANYFHFTKVDLKVIAGASKVELARWIRYQNKIKSDVCSDMYDPFTLQPLYQVPFMFLYQHFENGRTFCFDIIELVNAMNQFNLSSNPITGVPFGDETIGHIRTHCDLVLNLFSTLRQALMHQRGR